MANVNNFWQNLTKFNDSIQNFESFYDKIQFNRLFNIIFSAKFNSKIDSKLWNWLHSIQQNIHSIRKRRYRSGLSYIDTHSLLQLEIYMIAFGHFKSDQLALTRVWAPPKTTHVPTTVFADIDHEPNDTVVLYVGTDMATKKQVLQIHLLKAGTKSIQMEGVLPKTDAVQRCQLQQLAQSGKLLQLQMWVVQYKGR